MTDEQIDAERAKFEAYSSSKPDGGFTLERYKDPECTQYVHYNTQWAWEAWQARAVLAAQEAQEPAPLVGSSACPICGHDQPHAHMQSEVIAWLHAQASAYLRGVEIVVRTKAEDNRRAAEAQHRIDNLEDNRREAAYSQRADAFDGIKPAAPVAAASLPPDDLELCIQETAGRIEGQKYARNLFALCRTSEQVDRQLAKLSERIASHERDIAEARLQRAARPQPAPLPQTEQPTDGEMLDWLEAKHFTLHASRESAGDDELTLWWQVQDSKKSISGHPLGNARAAIAAAMKGQQP